MASHPAGLTQLARFLTENLVVLDIGCRWGFAPHWDALGSHVSLIGFDADEQEIHRLQIEHAGRANTRFVACTLGAERDRTVLFRTRERGGSSVFKPDLEHTSHLPDWEQSLIDDEVIVDVTTLDDWIAGEHIDRADSMKLDTQGSELGILRGGERTLRSVRHVEVEVSFNEISVDAPLFGEVDAFLRNHGFALWRLRDLVHYSLAEVRDALPIQEQFWHDSVPRGVTMPNGQLIWCNAHFVRREMYEPGTDASWELRLRDALIAGANGFHDLAVLALTRLLDADCPGEVREGAEIAVVALTRPSNEPAASGRGRATASGLRRRLGRLGSGTPNQQSH